ncbi:MAG: hypothetical protein JWM27_1474 [Gemmatimonadetes bacterium]|nr:hypothetical protein [Gemmatimonadota bacterium]
MTSFELYQDSTVKTEAALYPFDICWWWLVGV